MLPGEVRRSADSITCKPLPCPMLEDVGAVMLLVVGCTVVASLPGQHRGEFLGGMCMSPCGVLPSCKAPWHCVRPLHSIWDCQLCRLLLWF